MLRRLERHLPKIAEHARTPLAEVEAAYERLSGANTVPELFQLANIEYRAPEDFTRSGLPSGSVDVVFSNSVLEHVSVDVIPKIMVESARVLRKGGVTVHDVNCGDHYAYFDKTISQVHYLRYDSKQWNRWNTQLLFQNRLRAVDFVKAAEKEGLEIAKAVARPKAELVLELNGLALPNEFKHYSLEELAPTSLALVGRKR
jgi:SAM-dependent methyltransferase